MLARRPPRPPVASIPDMSAPPGAMDRVPPGCDRRTMPIVSQSAAQPSAEAVGAFREQGYVVARGLYSPEEAAAMREHVDGLRALVPRPEEENDGFYERDAKDPLLQWPRVFHPHRQDARTREWLLGARNTAWASALLDTTPLACQTMVYFKPPGSRGQAMHQDQYFLRARPGTSLAVWMALDRCDDANGCIRVVPGSQEWPVLCPTDADPEQSFTRESLPVPDDAPQIPVEMEAGDVLFFNGSIVHGSMPNRTPDRFRRALIAHFIEERATSSVDWIQPVLHPDGRELWLDEQDQGGGPCGTWVERDGARDIAMTGTLRNFSEVVAH